MRYFVILIMFTPLIAFCQPISVKKITNFDFESRNASFLVSSMNFYFPQDEIFFEGSEDSISNIYSLNYDVDADSFYQLNQLSQSDFINRRVSGQYIKVYPEVKMAIWETNKNGNWDISYAVDSGNGWSDMKLLFDSNEDELNASFILDPLGYYLQHDTIKIIFQRGNSVYLYSKKNTPIEELIFEGNDSIKYTDPIVGSFNGNPEYTLFALVVKTIKNENPILVFRGKKTRQQNWSDIYEIYMEYQVINPDTKIQIMNPQFFPMGDFSYGLSFEALIDGKKKILWFDEIWGGIEKKLLDNKDWETSDFSIISFEGPITKRKKVDFYYLPPYSFKYVKNDSVFIRDGILDNYQWPPTIRYTDFYTKVYDAKPAIGLFGWENDGIISYTIWEDSSGGKVNLFGSKRINRTVSMNDENPSEINFQLSQNYPNPFNPTTTITFSIEKENFVELKVYDILGREISTVVEKMLQQGNYEVNWDGTDFSSGVYYYRLKAGENVYTRKMLLIK